VQQRLDVRRQPVVGADHHRTGAQVRRLTLAHRVLAGGEHEDVDRRPEDGVALREASVPAVLGDRRVAARGEEAGRPGVDAGMTSAAALEAPEGQQRHFIGATPRPDGALS